MEMQKSYYHQVRLKFMLRKESQNVHKENNIYYIVVLVVLQRTLDEIINICRLDEYWYREANWLLNSVAHTNNARKSFRWLGSWIVIFPPGQCALSVGIGAEFAQASRSFIAADVLAVENPWEVRVAHKCRHGSALVVRILPSLGAGCRVSFEAVVHLWWVCAASAHVSASALVAIPVHFPVCAYAEGFCLVFRPVGLLALGAIISIFWLLIVALTEELRGLICLNPFTLILVSVILVSVIGNGIFTS